MSDPTLLPCPLDGGEADWIRYQECDDVLSWGIECSKCVLQVKWFNAQEAAAARWNRRAAPAAPQVVDRDGVLEALRAEREEALKLAFPFSAGVRGPRGLVDTVIALQKALTDEIAERQRHHVAEDAIRALKATPPPAAAPPDVLRSMTPEESARFTPLTDEQITAALEQGARDRDLAAGFSHFGSSRSPVGTETGGKRDGK